MAWPVRELIEEGIVSMLRVNMGLKEGERLLVVAAGFVAGIVAPVALLMR